MAETDYVVEGSDEYWEEFVKLDDGHQKRIARFLEHLKKTPTAKFSGMTALRGEQGGIYEYEVSHSNGYKRLFYTVDEETRRVRLEVISTHPTWTRSRDRMNIKNI